MPTPQRPRAAAATSVEPEPAKGSRTVSPGWLKALIQRFQDGNRLLRRVQLVAGVDPVDDVLGWRLRWRRVALHEQEGLFVAVGQQRPLGGVSLAEDDVPADAKARLVPGRGEEVIFGQP